MVAAEIEARSRPGDVVVDLFGRGGWVARTAVAQLRRSYTFESAPLTRLLAEIVLRPPDIRHFDAAVQSLSAHPRGDTSLRLAIAAQFTSRCPTCGRSVLVDEFIWDGEADAPFRKSYRCVTCRDQVGGGEQRTAPTDEADAARAREAADADANLDRLLSRYPIAPGLEELPAQLLSLYTPRTLTALRALVDRLDGDLRAAPVEAALRLALLRAVLPASKLNSYPGRVAALRISNGRVRLPGATSGASATRGCSSRTGAGWCAGSSSACMRCRGASCRRGSETTFSTLPMRRQTSSCAVASRIRTTSAGGPAGPTDRIPAYGSY